MQQEIVAIFQGQSEWGPRALGNRSLLFDPRNKDGKDIVNKVKNREWYRPFAGISVYLEHANDWFEMGVNKRVTIHDFCNTSERRKEKSLIPCITHVDGTCRIQTVTQRTEQKFL